LSHQGKIEYANKWLREERDGLCKTCGKNTLLDRFAYIQFCSAKCMGLNKELNLVKKQTKKEKYGDENYVNTQKTKETCLEKYGDKNYHNFKKSKETCFKNYGVNSPQQNKNIKEKTKQTCLKRYGVEYPYQNYKIFLKVQQKGFTAKKYNDTDIYYRGTYELDFLEKYYNKYADIINATSIKYIFNKKRTYLFSRFLYSFFKFNCRNKKFILL